MLGDAHRLQIRDVLRDVDAHLLPPDSRQVLQPYWTMVCDAGRAPGSQRTYARIPEARVRELGLLLQDALASTGRRDEDGWRPVTDEEARTLAHLRQWVDQDPTNHRHRVARQLLWQSAGLAHGLNLGTDHEPPVLPPIGLLDRLLSSTVQARLTIPGDARAVVPLIGALEALPVRTCRLTHMDTLRALLDEVHLTVRELDLRPLRQFSGFPLSPADHMLLGRAAREWINLCVVRLPLGLHTSALGPGWETNNSEDGIDWVRTSGEDGLALLDEAVSAWNGRYLSTRMPIGHIASHPDAAELLRLAERLGRVSGPPQTRDSAGPRVQRILTDAARNPGALNDCAGLVRLSMRHPESPGSPERIQQVRDQAADVDDDSEPNVQMGVRHPADGVSDDSFSEQSFQVAPQNEMSDGSDNGYSSSTALSGEEPQAAVMNDPGARDGEERIEVGVANGVVDGAVNGVANDAVNGAVNGAADGVADDVLDGAQDAVEDAIPQRNGNVPSGH